MMPWYLILCLASLLGTMLLIAMAGAGYLLCILVYTYSRGDNNG